MFRSGREGSVSPSSKPQRATLQLQEVRLCVQAAREELASTLQCRQHAPLHAGMSRGDRWPGRQGQQAPTLLNRKKQRMQTCRGR
mmetsp:Transcript_6440/g.16244  ORF Transcript_6440/g.16244 Transcript_6440/m.16244 type:complete len:85 (+) Transcript_6440:1509-1763(+)